MTLTKTVCIYVNTEHVQLIICVFFFGVKEQQEYVGPYFNRESG